MTGNNEQTISEAPGKGGMEIDRMPVKISHLDTLLGLTGEIIIAASNVSILQRHLTSGGGATVDKETMEMVKLANMTTSRISSDLHHLVMDIRMVSIKETFLRFRRLVRDTAKKRGRQVNFEIVGEDTLVDKTVAERLYEPLAHQIRNAVDHGIEDPLERQHIGKPAAGTLVLTAYKKEGYTFVSVSDDGRGLDVDRIRQVAAEKGFRTPEEANALSDDAAMQLIMAPGFSTAREATEISGRGVGMDVVKSTVEAMGGEVAIASRPGSGSLFTYKIPQLSAVNITDAVIIRAGEQYFAVPVGNVVATQAVKRNDISTTMGRNETIFYLDSVLPLHDLLQLLDGRKLADEDGHESMPVIIIEAKNGRIACKVSEFIRPQKLVLIPLPDGFRVCGLSGTTILGGSQLGMIIDPFQLVAMAGGTDLEPDVERHTPFPAPEEGGKRTRILTHDIDGSNVPVSKMPDSVSIRKAAPPPEPAAKPELEGGVAEEFFVEIQGILKELNEDIFQLEKEPESVPRVNTIFRHFHSIKGNFMMTGFTGIGGFIHDVESVLDRIREKKLAVSQEVIDLLLDAVKNLESGLAVIRSGQKYDVTDSDLLSALSRYHRKDTREIARELEPVEEDGVFKMSPLGTLLYHAKMGAPGINIFQSMIQIRQSFQDSSLVAYLIIKRLTLIADIIDTAPSLDRIERGIAKGKLKIMFASRHSLEEMNRFFSRQLVRYYSVEMFENLVME